MKLKQRNTIGTRMKLKRAILFSACFATVLYIGSLMYFNVGTVQTAKASTTTETIDSGSFIINLGIVPQTISNGLKPYGMVYDLIFNYETPVKWVFNENKVKDGTDFTYNGIAYKGGSFIIPAIYINSNVKARIAYWMTQGVQGIYTTSVVSVPVFSTLTSVPKVMIDTTSGKQSIIKKYFTNAMMPANSYYTGSTSDLTGCFDVWVNPHGDPTWASHQWLYDFAITNGSFIFSQCHATSMMEGCKNPVAPFQQLNFLTTNGLKCYSGGKCGPAITETHGGSPIAPYTTYYPGDPIMQFMGNIAPALSGGSEDWFIPQSTGGWRPTTRRCVTTADGISPREGVLLVYGPAYGLANVGWVMYEAGHDLDGIKESDVAAQRCFFNFLMFAGTRKSLDLVSSGGTSELDLQDNKLVSVVASGGHAPYTYKWSASSSSIKFSDATSPSTTVRVPSSVGRIGGIISVKITDVCGKQNFISRPFKVVPSVLPVLLSSFTASLNNENKVQLSWTTASEKDNDYFTVERSSDATHFVELTRVKGAGNSNNLLRYSHIDEHPYSGNSYYRVKQTDYNGKSETFKTVTVKIKAGDLSTIKVYPNPFSKFFTVEFEAPHDCEMQARLYSAGGVLVQSEEISASKGQNNYRFETSLPLVNGTYVFRLMNGNVVQGTVKLLCRDE